VEKLSQRIKSKIINQAPKSRNVHIAILISMQEEIKQCLDDGWTRTIIWQALVDEKKLSCSYSQFNRFIRQHLNINLSKKPKPKTETNKAHTPFHYSPVYKEEELI